MMGLGNARRGEQLVGEESAVAQTMLAIHLLNHEGSPEAAVENRVSHLHQHLRWDPDFARGVVRRAEAAGLLSRLDDDRLDLTDRGRAEAREAMTAVA